MRERIVGYHLVIGAYGFWLPNDPRGSWSQFVGSDAIFKAAGKATTTSDHRSLARRAHDPSLRRAGKLQLQRRPLRFTGPQSRAIARGFKQYIEQNGRDVWAFAIMPDHVHLVIGVWRLTVEQFSVQLKAAATRQLISEGLHPYQDARDYRGVLPKIFVRGEWAAFLYESEVNRAIQYVEENPIKAGLKAQRWSFVTKRR